MKKIPEKYANPGKPVIASPAVIFGGEMVWCAGQCCDDYEGWDGSMPDDIKEQTRMTIRACKEKLEAAGTSLENVVYVEVNLTDMDEWPAFNEVYLEMIPDPKPARKAVKVGLLPGYKVELVMIAAKEK